MIEAMSVAIFLATAAIIAASGYRVWVRHVAASGEAPGILSIEQHSTPAQEWLRFVGILGSCLPASPLSRLETRRELTAAGYRSVQAAPVYRGLKILSGILATLVAAAVCYSAQPEVWRVTPVALMTGYIGFRGPTWVLHRLMEQRRSALNRALPDLLDLMIIGIESGLSLDYALISTARSLARIHPVLHEEFSLFQWETQAGTPPAEALRNLSRRSGETELRKLTALLIQAQRFGSSITKMLRAHARYIRLCRRLIAEERARKLRVKMIFPIFFLIMPSIFLVTAGPAFLYLRNNLHRLMDLQP